MITDGLPPFSPILLILPFKDLFNDKLLGLPRSSLSFRKITEVNNAKPAAADIAYRIPPFQFFTLRDPGQNTVKMDRPAGIPVRDGCGNILYRLAAPGTIRDRQGAGG
jgi:hypothetical protein